MSEPLFSFTLVPELTNLKLAIIITHPIRYFVPLVQLLTKRDRIRIKVFYTYGPELLKTKKYDPENWKKTEPGLPIYEGYDYTFVHNAAKNKSTYSYKGIDNPGLISEVENWKPGVILICGWKFRSHLKVLRYFKGKLPVHFRGDSTLLDETSYSWLRKITRYISLKWVYRHIDKAWYAGTNNKVYFRKFGLKEHQLVFVPHSVDNKRFSRTTALRQESLLLRRKMGIPDNAVVFLYAGKLQKSKGIFTLLSAFNNANPVNAHLLFVGTGKDEQLLKQMSAGKPHIHFLPFQTQTAMPFIYSTSEVLVLPSKSDTWGLVINEAMANGLAVIASNQCGAAVDLIEQGKNGFVFPYNNEDRLSQIIRELSSNLKKTEDMGKCSLQKISKFSYDVAADAIEDLLLRNVNPR